MAGLKTWNPKSTSVIAAGAIMEGFAAGTFIEITPNTEEATFEVGAQGDGTRVISSDDSHQIKIVLQKTSNSNAILEIQRLAQKLAGGGIFSFYMKDNDSKQTFLAPEAFIRKSPDFTAAVELTNYEWILEAPSVKRILPLS